jgi:molybdopterin-guanine dinucleotide biosynthesis protein A
VLDAAPPPAAPVGVILAGGASARFGTPKGLARVAGVRIVDRVAAALHDAAGELLLVANHPGADAWLPGTPVISDRLAGGGGWSGVHAALVHTGRPVLVVAWDMPFVSGALLCALWGRGQAAGAWACYPESGASPVGIEPFCACYTPACVAPLERAIGERRAGGAQFARSLDRAAFLTRADVRALGDPDRLLFSVNTPADLARAEALAAGTL